MTGECLWPIRMNWAYQSIHRLRDGSFANFEASDAGNPRGVTTGEYFGRTGPNHGFLWRP
jgi:hypothetical protein